jgi:hypothetical protein
MESAQDTGDIHHRLLPSWSPILDFTHQDKDSWCVNANLLSSAHHWVEKPITEPGSWLLNTVDRLCSTLLLLTLPACECSAVLPWGGSVLSSPEPASPSGVSPQGYCPRSHWRSLALNGLWLWLSSLLPTNVNVHSKEHILLEQWFFKSYQEL